MCRLAILVIISIYLCNFVKAFSLIHENSINQIYSLLNSDELRDKNTNNIQHVSRRLANTISLIENTGSIVVNFDVTLTGAEASCISFASATATGATKTFQMSFTSSPSDHWPADLEVAFATSTTSLSTSQYIAGNNAGNIGAVQLLAWATNSGAYTANPDTSTCWTLSSSSSGISLSAGFSNICFINICGGPTSYCTDYANFVGQVSINGFTTTTSKSLNPLAVSCAFAQSPTARPSTRPTPRPSPSPTSRPSPSPTSRPSPSPTPRPSPSPTSRPSPSPTPRPSPSPTPRPSPSPTPRPSPSPTKVPTGQPTRQPSSQPSRQPSCQPSRQPTSQPSSQPTAQPTRQPSTQPTTMPTTQPSIQPTSQPSRKPSSQPTSQPFSKPTTQPSTKPSTQPSSEPSSQPTDFPTSFPSSQPSSQPSSEPSQQPTSQPSGEPSSIPSSQPSSEPSVQPTRQPSAQPTDLPSSQPTSQPSSDPTSQPSTSPSSQPTEQPSSEPTSQPTSYPTSQPSQQPTAQPSSQPTHQPSSQPSVRPSSQPTRNPTCQPSQQPTSHPSQQPSSQPYSRPSSQPSSYPSAQPTSHPSSQPSLRPSSQPSDHPSGQPTSQPFTEPSSVPSMQPTAKPSSQPTMIPTSQPTTSPSMQPSSLPTSQPSCSPSCQPTSMPSMQPSAHPSSQPSSDPSISPSSYPTSVPTSNPSSKPTSIPSAKPSFRPSSQPTSKPSLSPTPAPTPSPSPRPTCNPSAFPSVSPSAKPTPIPTSRPTESFARVHSITVEATSKNSLEIRVGMDSPNLQTSGTLYCYASVDASLSSFPQVQRLGTSLPFASIATQSVLLTSLRPSTEYFVYCGIVTSFGFVSSNSSLQASKVSATTLCCINIVYTNAPSTVYGDFSLYLSTNPSVYTFTFALDYAPDNSIRIIPVIQPLSNSTLTLTSAPSSFTITSTSSLRGSFILLGDSYSAGKVSIELQVEGKDSAKYSNSVTIVDVFSSAFPLAAPTILAARYADDGASLFVIFNTATNRAGLFAGSFACSRLFSFAQAADSRCSWLNDSAIQVSLSSKLQSSDLLPGSNITLVALNLQAKCLPNSICFENFNSSNIVVPISVPMTHLTPAVALSVPKVIGSCDNLTIDASASAGSGGRNWLSIEWQVNGPDGVSVPSVEAYLTEVATDIYRNVIVPAGLLAEYPTYSITLTLTNFFGYVSNASVSVQISGEPNLPFLVLRGGPMFSYVSKDAISISVSASVSTCANSSVITYAKTLFLNDVDQRTLSQSNDPRTYLFKPYSLVPGNTYQAVFTASSPASGSYASAASSISATITIRKGQIVALISGGTQRRVPVDSSFSLNASDSYDEDSVSSVLAYSWFCSIASAESYGSDCGSIFVPSTINSYLVTVQPYSMNISSTYAVQVQVSSSDSRFSTYTVFIQAIPTPVSTAIVTTSSEYNADTVVTLQAILQADESFQAFWTVYFGGLVTTYPTNSPLTDIFSASEAIAGITFPISFPANTFTQGLTYTLRLSAHPLSNSTQLSYSEVSIIMNSPPTSGSISVNPAVGTELVTTFYIFCSGWVTSSSSLPLSFSFSYQLSTFQPSFALSTKSSISSISTNLPSGLINNENKIDLTVVIYNSLDASATSSTFVSVYPPTSKLSSSTLSKLVTDNVQASFSSGNIEAVLKTINVVAAVTSAVSCDLTNSTFCASLNRNKCESQPNTCGSCLDGFMGINGPFNDKCIPSHLNVSLDGTCADDYDCAFGSCSASGLCMISEKKCPSSSEGVCSGHGSCIFLDASDRAVPTCLVTDTRCFAQCSCEAGFGGIDCSLSSSDMIARDSLRAQLCQSILNISFAQDSSGTLLDTLVGSLSSSFSAYEVTSVSSRAVCLSAFQHIVSLAKEGYLRNAKRSTVTFLVDLLSAYIYSGIFTSFDNYNATSGSGSSDLASSLTDAIVVGILATMVDGQEAQQFISEFVQMNVIADRTSKFANASLSAPQTPAEIVYGSVSQSISLSSSGLDDCANFHGYNRFALTQWAKNPLPNSNDVLTPLLKVSTLSTQVQLSRKLIDSYLTRVLSLETTFLVTFQFSQNQNFNFSEDWLSINPKNFPSNLTIPTCESYSSSSFAFETCRSCNLSSYTNFNVSFSCRDVSLICEPELPDRRRLMNHDPEESRSLQSSDVQTSIFGTALLMLSSVLSANPFSFSYRQAESAGILVGTMLFVIALGIWYFSRWDRLDHDFIIYVRKDEKAMKLHDEWKSQGSLFLQNKALNFTRGRRRTKSTAETTSKPSSWSNSNKSVLNSAMQSKYLLNDYNSFFLMYQAFTERHDYISPFAKPSLRIRRSLRWFRLVIGILTAIFVDTLFFGIFYPDDGFCEENTSYESCLESYNRAVSRPTCQWEFESTLINGGKCSLDNPPTSFLFTIILALITVLVALPLLLLGEYIIENIVSKRPDFEQIGLYTNEWLGSTTLLELAEKIHLFSRLKEVKRLDKVSSLPPNQLLLRQKAKQAYTELKLVDEEVEDILTSAKVFLRSCCLPAKESDKSIVSTQKQMTVRAIARDLGIDIDGSAITLTVRQKLLYGDNWHRILSRVSKARRKCDMLMSNIRNFTAKETTFKNEYLIQHFVLEQLPFLKRYCVKKYFFAFDVTSPDSIDLFVWIGGWLFLLSEIGFFLYYLFNWIAINGGNTVRYWLLNFFIALIQDIFFVQFARIYLTYVLGILASRSQLRNIYRTLQNVSMRMNDEEIDVRTCSNFHVVHYLSGTCRAAWKFDLENLHAAQILRTVNDGDVHNCRHDRGTPLGLLPAIVLFIPSILAVVLGDVMSKYALEATLHSSVSGFLLFNHALLNVSPVVLAIPYIVVVCLIIYKVGLLEPILRRRRQRLSSQNDASSRYWQSMTSIVLNGLDIVIAIISLSFIIEVKENRSRIDSKWLETNKAPTLSSYSHHFDIIDDNTPCEVQEMVPKGQKPLCFTDFIPDYHSLFPMTEASSLQKDEILISEELMSHVHSEYILYSNDCRSEAAIFYRDKHVTQDLAEGIRRVYLRLRLIQCRNSGLSIPLVDYEESLMNLRQYNAYHSIDEYALAMEVVWINYHPRSQALSVTERDEILELLIEWSMMELEEDEGAYFIEFLIWFYRTMTNLERLRDFQSDEVAFLGELSHQISIYYKSHRDIDYAAGLLDDITSATITDHPTRENFLVLGLKANSGKSKLEPQENLKLVTLRQLHNHVRGVISTINRKMFISPTAHYDEYFCREDILTILGEYSDKISDRFVAVNVNNACVQWLIQQPDTGKVSILDFILWLYSYFQIDVEESFGLRPLSVMGSLNFSHFYDNDVDGCSARENPMFLDAAGSYSRSFDASLVSVKNETKSPLGTTPLSILRAVDADSGLEGAAMTAVDVPSESSPATSMPFASADDADSEILSSIKLSLKRIAALTLHSFTPSMDDSLYQIDCVLVLEEFMRSRYVRIINPNIASESKLKELLLAWIVTSSSYERTRMVDIDELGRWIYSLSTPQTDRDRLIEVVVIEKKLLLKGSYADRHQKASCKQS
jgi:hypothetical protein